MTAWSESLLLLDTRTWSFCTVTLTFLSTPFMNLVISRALSASIPCSTLASRLTVPFGPGCTGPHATASSGTSRLVSRVSMTSIIALRWNSSEEFTVTVSCVLSMREPEPLKSNLLSISLRAWLSALSSSGSSTLLTMSKELSVAAMSILVKLEVVHQPLHLDREACELLYRCAHLLHGGGLLVGGRRRLLGAGSGLLGNGGDVVGRLDHPLGAISLRLRRLVDGFGASCDVLHYLGDVGQRVEGGLDDPDRA